MGDVQFRGVQLANHWEGWSPGAVSVCVEPKYDGYRLSAIVNDDGSVSFHCREAEPPKWIEHLGHLALEIQELDLLPGMMLDGEVMAEDWNETSKLLRHFRETMDDDERQRIRDEVKFHCFDVVDLNALVTLAPVGRQRKPRLVDPKPQYERRALLEQLLGTDRESGWGLQLVVSHVARSQEEVDAIYKQHCVTHEGSIVKDAQAPYYFNRSDAWLKVKPTTTNELTITHAVEGQGKHVGRLGALVGTLPNGDTVSVGTGFDDAERAQLWAARETLAGLRAEISYQSGKVAKARHPVFHRMRDLG